MSQTERQPTGKRCPLDMLYPSRNVPDGLSSTEIPLDDFVSAGKSRMTCRQQRCPGGLTFIRAIPYGLTSTKMSWMSLLSSELSYTVWLRRSQTGCPNFCEDCLNIPPLTVNDLYSSVHTGKPTFSGDMSSTTYLQRRHPRLPAFSGDILDDLPSTEMSWMAKRRMMVQIIPSVIFKLPSTISKNQITGTR